jgi:hypothetical protein
MFSFGFKVMILTPKKGGLKKTITDFAETELCPDCSRQGQIFSNDSKRNQKLVEKVE